jgi:periplasmic copper chaperone A
MLNRVLVATLITSTLLSSNVLAHSKKHNALVISHPWTHEGAGHRAVIRMSIKNTGQKADRLLAVTCNQSTTSIVHGTQGSPNAIELPPTSITKLGPQGAFVALSGLKHALTAYDRIAVTLMFEDAGAVDVEVLVEPVE